MSKLLIKPTAQSGKAHDITPESAGWRYVGFGLYRLAPGETAEEATGDREAILVLVEGKADINAANTDFGELGERLDVVGQKKPWSVYVPAKSSWRAKATTDCVLAVCTAPAEGKLPARVIDPRSLAAVTRGKGANTRHIHPIAMEESDIAESLLVTEVYTPQGNWSSYPPHRHDEDDYPRMTYLEETYYHRLNPKNGYAHQRVFTEDGALDESIVAMDGDVVLVPKGHHPCGAPYGFDLYYLNVMAGPMRKWRFQNHPDFDWIYQRDSG